MDPNYIGDFHRNRVTLLIYWGMRALVFLAAIGFFVDGHVPPAAAALFISILMSVPSVMRRYRFYFPFALDWGIVVFTFATLFMGHLLDFYDRVPGWDKFLHFQSGLLFGVMAFVAVYILNEHERLTLDLSPGFIALFTITFAVTIGTFWEIWEFSLDKLLHTAYWQGVLVDDTMWDLIADATGGIVVATVGYFWMHSYKRLPFTPWVMRILRREG